MFCNPPLFRQSALLAAAIQLLGAGVAPAQDTLNWRSEAANGNWNDANNWWNGTGTQTPAGNEILRFGNDTQTTMANDLTGGATNRFRIFFDAGATSARTISGSTANTFFDFGTVRPLMQNDSTATHALNFPVAVGPDYDLELNPVNGNLTLGGTLVIPVNRKVQVWGNNTKTLTLGGIISGAGGLSLEQNSVVLLNAANTFSGPVTVNAGTLRLGNASALGSAASVTVNAGGTLDAAGFSTANAISISGTGNGSNPALWNSAAAIAATISSLTLNNDASIGNNSTNTSSTLVLSTLNLNSQKLSIGAGAVQIGIRNIPSGNIDINSGGTLYSQNGGTLTSVSGTITINSGGLMDTRDTDNTAMTSVHAIYLNGGTLGRGNLSGNNGGGAGTTLKNNITVDSVNGGSISNSSSGGFGMNYRLAGTLTGSGPLALGGGVGVEFQGDVSGYTSTATSSGSGTVFFNGSADQTFNGVLAGTRPVQKSGSRILTLTANNTYNGATTVSAGALVGVTGGSCSNTTITVSNGATNGVQVLTAGGQWTCASLTSGSSSADLTFMDFNYGATAPSTTTAPLQVNGNLALNARVGVLVRGSGFTATGTYPLVKYTGNFSGTAPTAPWSLPGGMIATLNHNTGTKTLELVVTALNTPTSIWATGSGAWDINATPNWTNAAGAPVNYLEGNSVLFNNPTTASTISLNTTVNPAGILGGVTFNNPGNAYTVSGSGAIAGAVGLIKSGAGELTLGTANTYTGGTVLNGGTLRVATANSALGTGPVTIAGNATLATASGGGARTLANAITINSGQTLSLDGGYADLTLSGALSGAAAVNKVSSGTVTFSTQKTYTGGTTVNAGILDLTGGGGSGGTIRGTVIVNGGGTLRLSTGDATGYGTGSDRLSTINLTNGGVLNVNTTANQTLGNCTINMTGGAITGISGANLDYYAGASALNTFASSTTATLSGTKINLRQNNGVTFTVATGTTASGVDLDVQSVISHSTGFTANRLIKAGAGTLRLTNNNTYAVPTLIYAGKLVGVTGGSCANSILSLSNNTTLGVQVLTTGGQWICAGLTNLGTGTAEFNFFAASPSATTAPLQVNGDVINNGTLNVSIVGNVIPVGTYPLIKYTGTLTVGTLGTVTLPGGTATLVNNTGNKSIDLNVTVPNQITWQGGTGNWNINTTANWTNANGTAVTYLDGSAVVLDDTTPGTGPFTVTLSAAVRPASVIINNASKTYTTAGSAGILGSTALTKSGAGTLTLGVNTNSFSGGTTVNGGTLALGGGGTGSDTSTANAMGLGPVTVNTGGTVKFWIQNSKTFYITNPFTLNGGTLLGQDGNYRLIGGVTVGSSGANFQTVWAGKNLHFDSPVGGAGSLRFSGTEFYFNAINTYSGPTTISSGTLNVGSTSQLGGGSYSGLITNNGTLIYNGSSAQTLSGVISGTGPLVKSNTSTLTLSGANTYTGTTTVAGGTLEVQNNASGVGKGYTIHPGATLKLGYSTSTSWGGGNSVVVNGNGVADASGLYLKGGQTLQFGSTLTLQTAPSTVRAYGTGSAVLNGGDVNNTHLSVATTGSGSVMDSDVNIACVNYGYRMNVASGANTASGDLVVKGVISGSGSVSWGGANNNLIKYGNGSVKLTGASTYSSGAWIAGGALILSGGANRVPAGTTVSLGDGTSSAALILDGVSQTLAGINVSGTGTANAVVGGSTTTSTLLINNASTVAFSGAVGGAGANQNNLSLAKTGAGALTLSGSLTYTGNTTVSAGTVKVGSLTVADAATLSVVDVAGTFTADNLQLGTASGSTVAITGFASASSAPIIATNLTVNGETMITLAGVFTTGQYPLIRYVSGSLSGGGSFAVNPAGLPRGVAATVVTNEVDSTIDVVLTANPLVWVGATNGVDVATWDIGLTTNWSLLGSPDYFINNDNVRIDDTATGSTSLNLVETVNPFAILVTNAAKDFTLGAAGDAALAGNMILTKQGPGLLTLTSSNAFTGGVTISGGAVNVQHGRAFGGSAVTVASGAELQVQGGIAPVPTALTLSGTGTNNTGALRSLGGNNSWAANITLADSARIHSESGSLTLNSGNLLNLGENLLTLGGTGNITLTNVLGTGASALVKEDAGTVTFSGSYRGSTLGNGGMGTNLTINGGTLTFASGYFNTSPFGYRTLSILVNSGATLRQTASHALGGDNSDGGTSWGQVRLFSGTYELNADQYISGGTVAGQGRLILSAGTVNGTGELRSVDGGGSTITVLPAVTPSTIATRMGVRGTVNLDVADGAAAHDLIISNNLRLDVAGGGLTKNGSGTAALLGYNTYSGNTLLNEGTLLMNGTNAGPGGVLVAAAATLTGTGRIAGVVNNNGTLAPGAGGIGTLTLSNAPVLNGTLLAEINRSNAQTADTVVLTDGTLALAGTLTVENAGPAPVNGDVFQILDAPAYAGSFSSLNLPPGGTAHWVTSQLAVNGTLMFTNNNPAAKHLTLGVGHGASVTLTVIGGKNAPTDADGDPVTIEGVGTPSSGSVSFTATTLTYTASGSAGTNTFTYTVSDGFGGTDTKTVTVLVAPVSNGANIVPGTLQVTGNNVKLDAFGIPGATYRLEFTENLTPPITWTPLTGSEQTAAPNGTMSFDYTHDVPLPQSGFFRTQYVSGP